MLETEEKETRGEAPWCALIGPMPPGQGDSVLNGCLSPYGLVGGHEGGHGGEHRRKWFPAMTLPRNAKKSKIEIRCQENVT
jgi:hypothetical protein